MWGEIIAVLTAFLWAISTVILARTLRDIDPLNVNTFKTLFAAIFMIPIAWFMGEIQNIENLNFLGLGLVVLAAVIGFGVGDICLLKSITLIGAARSYTVSYTFPFFTMLLAIIVLNEPFNSRYLLGAVIIFLGILNIVILSPNSNKGNNVHGLFLAFSAALLWSVATILVTLGIREISVILANTLRFPILFIFLLLISRHWSKRPNLTRKNLLLLAVSGILGMTIAGVTFLTSLNLIGASRATPLSSSSPVWASLMIHFFLKEKITVRVIVSSIMVVAGIYFLT